MYHESTGTAGHFYMASKKTLTTAINKWLNRKVEWTSQSGI